MSKLQMLKSLAKTGVQKGADAVKDRMVGNREEEDTDVSPADEMDHDLDMNAWKMNIIYPGKDSAHDAEKSKVNKG